MLGEHVVDEGVAAEHRLHAVGVRSDEGDAARPVEREDAIVGEQHHGPLGQRSRQATLLGSVEVLHGRRRVLERGTQQAQVVLLPEHPLHRSVDQGLRDATVLDGLGQGSEVGVAGGQLHVDAGLQRLRGSLRQVAGDTVQQVEEGDAVVVGDHGAVEAPLLAQHAGEQRLVRRDRDSVDLGVGVHHRPDAALEDGHLERGQQDVAELARSGVHRREVAPGLRRRVAHEVLEGRVHPGPLETADVRGAEHADQVGVLAHALLDAAPAGIADDVQHRRQALVHAKGPHRASDGLGHRFDELGVEGRTPRERGGEGRGLPGRQPGEALLVDEGGDAQAGVAHQAPLEVPQPGLALGGVDGAGPVHAGELTQPVLGGVGQRRAAGEVALQRCHGLSVALVPEAHELGELLGEGHLLQQGLDRVGVGGGRPVGSRGGVGAPRERGGSYLGHGGRAFRRWWQSGSPQPLTAPWSPLTMRRCRSRKKARAGSIARVVNAKTPAVSEEYWVEKSATPRGRVLRSPCSSRRGRR